MGYKLQLSAKKHLGESILETLNHMQSRCHGARGLSESVTILSKDIRFWNKKMIQNSSPDRSEWTNRLIQCWPNALVATVPASWLGRVYHFRPFREVVHMITRMTRFPASVIGNGPTISMPISFQKGDSVLNCIIKDKTPFPSRRRTYRLGCA